MFAGHGEGAELCLGTAGSLGLVLSCIFPCRLRLWREQPCSFPCSWWGWGGRLGARSCTGILQPDTGWHHQRDVQENQGRIGARGPWGDLEGEGTHRPFFPHTILCKLLPPPWVSAWVQAPLRAPIQHGVPKQPGVPHTLNTHTHGLTLLGREGWDVLGDCWHIPDIEAGHPRTVRDALALASPDAEHSGCNASRGQHGHHHRVPGAALLRKPAFASQRDSTDRRGPLHRSCPTPHHGMGARVRWTLVVRKAGPSPPASSHSSAEGCRVGGGLARLHLLQLILLGIGEGQPIGTGHGLALGAAGGGVGDAG